MCVEISDEGIGKQAKGKEIEEGRGQSVFDESFETMHYGNYTILLLNGEVHWWLQLIIWFESKIPKA